MSLCTHMHALECVSIHGGGGGGEKEREKEISHSYNDDVSLLDNEKLTCLDVSMTGRIYDLESMLLSGLNLKRLINIDEKDSILIFLIIQSNLDFSPMMR